MINRLRRPGPSSDSNTNTGGSDGGQGEASPISKGFSSRRRRRTPLLGGSSTLTSSSTMNNSNSTHDDDKNNNNNNNNNYNTRKTIGPAPEPTTTTDDRTPYGRLQPLSRDHNPRSMSTPETGSTPPKSAGLPSTSLSLLNLPDAWRINDPSLRCPSSSAAVMVTISAGGGEASSSSSSSSQSASADKRTVYANRPIPSKLHFQQQQQQQQQQQHPSWLGSPSHRGRGTSVITATTRMTTPTRGRSGGNHSRATAGQRTTSVGREPTIGSSLLSTTTTTTTGNKRMMYPTLDEHDAPPPPGIGIPSSSSAAVAASNVHASSQQQVYYFEVTLSFSTTTKITTLSSSSVPVAVGFICEEREAFGVWPGDLPDSIGWGSRGLHVNGRRSSGGTDVPPPPTMMAGDVVGCGIETTGMQRVFFTYNGHMVVPPTAFLSSSGSSNSNNNHGDQANCFPTVAFVGTSTMSDGGKTKARLDANFGLDASRPFRWSGSDNMSFLTQQSVAGRIAVHAASTGSIPTSPSFGSPYSSTHKLVTRDLSKSPSPYYSLQNLETMEGSESVLTRSMNQRPSTTTKVTPSTPVPTFTASSTVAISKHPNPPEASSLESISQANLSRRTTSSTDLPASAMSPKQTQGKPEGTLYGVNNSKRSLVDDDPSTSVYMDHFNLSSQRSSPSTAAFPSSGPQVGMTRWSPGMVPGRGGSGTVPSPVAGNINTSSAAPRIVPTAQTDESLGGNADASLRGLDARHRRGQRSGQRRAGPQSNSAENSSESSLEQSFSPRSGHSRGPDVAATSSRITHSVSAGVMSSSMSHATQPTLSTSVSMSVAGNSNLARTQTFRHDPMFLSTGNEDGERAEPTTPIANGARSIVVGAAGNLLQTAKDNAENLRSASSADDIDIAYLTELLEFCRKDQEKLQEKLSTALEEADAIENLEELFGVNDGICSAIEAGKESLKREKAKAKKKSVIEGPTIDLLVDNEDVFSLICTLRAPNEKRLQAALALMKFAQENETLRNEIRSSGGVHSFLTLFRTKDMPLELLVVSCLAITYVLPSYVTSSQTSASVGLKIVECLRFLVSSGPISSNGVVFSREFLCSAASSGVHVLWIHVIQPLVTMERVKKESRKAKMALRPSQSSRLIPGRVRSRYGGGVFDQGQESIEIQELTELAVTLIAHLAKLTQSKELNFDMDYGIVEQVCEMDEARPIAVREGLLTVFVEWIRSGDVDKIRPAASALRYLISISDKYMAGWIHSQVVNEGAIGEIVKLLTASVGHDVRVAVAQMLSALCVAPHTRAAVVDANCVSYLVALLYEHTAPDSEEIVFCAGSALLQLSAGALTLSRAMSGSVSLDLSDSLLKQENVVNEIIEGWAHGSFVQIALDHLGKLRSVSVEALRVLSEDTNSDRQTRLQLCNAGAAEALGRTIKDHSLTIEPMSIDDRFESGISDIMGGSLSLAVKDTYESLRGLANMLEPLKETSRKGEGRASSRELKPKELLIKGCLDIARSGGLAGILWVAALENSPSYLAESDIVTLDRVDLLEEACRLLANLAPLLLSHTAASKGVTKWAGDVFEAFDGVLMRLKESDDGAISDSAIELNIDALKGIGQLAGYEPLKFRIVNRTLPKLLLLKSLSGERSDIATAANQVLLSLGFTEDEITVQVAGNNPQLLVDWFCLQRALLLQSMARIEIRGKVLDLWQLPFSEMDTENLEEMRLIRQVSQQSSVSNSTGDDKSVDSDDGPVIRDLFQNFTDDYETRDTRAVMVRQYGDVYEPNSPGGPRSVSSNIDADTLIDGEEGNLMAPHVFPLNDISEEKEWILNHRRAMELCTGLQKFCVSGTMPERVEKLLDCCFPSKLLRNNVLPVNDLSPRSSFNFRALMMPKRRYFSFRREGQLLARLCDKQAAVIDSDNVHWTLGFTNSTFAGEFVESLVQTLYLCPMIRGISFVRNSEWLTMRDIDKEIDGDDGGGLLANLTGSLPPWVSFLTFDNMLGDRDMRALVAILDTMGRLSSGQDFDDDTSQVSEASIGQSQGKFNGFSIRNSPQITRESWSAFLQMIGKMGPTKRNLAPAPLSSLKILDLSGNKLGDEAAAMVLELVHDKDSGCCLERLDLSGNRIGRGTNMVRVLCAYTEYYRYNQTVGVKMLRKSWKSSLHTLILAENDLFLGQSGLEIFALLKHNALSLRYLDLSNNSLEGDTYQLLASSLLKNTSLCHLNLSGNKFSPALIDLILDHLNNGDVESSLSFLLLENNSPSLNEGHRSKLAKFLRKSRKRAIERYLKEIESEIAVAGDASEWQGGELDLIDEVTTSILSRDSIVREAPRSSLQPGLDSAGEKENKITVLFSAPLVFADGESKLHPFDKLDFEMERELLWQCMKEASRDIEMSFDNAHHSRLLATVTRRCNVLHYSGHGHPSFLPFEDGMGGPNWLNVQNIKELILRDGVVPFKFVFVSACHSGLAGETFASAGVPHVVCCKQESELKDTAALAFTRSFYLALLVGHTVKESFDQGKKAVRATPNLKDPDKEMRKFVLLPDGGDHNVPVFNAKSIREWPKQSRNQGLVPSKSSRRRGSRTSLLLRTKSTLALGAKNSELSVRNMMQEDPSPTAPQFFLGREVDMYYILSALLKLKKRLVTVLGDTGIGRSSLVCALCHYINERASTISEIQHIYFIKPKHGGSNVSCRSLLRQLLDKLEEVDKCRPTDEDTDTEGMLDIICRSLKQDKALIVFDRTEMLEKSDESQELPMILSTILYETKQVKVIITARNALGQPSIGGQVEHSFNLGPLNFSSTVKLFSNLCPYLHTPSDRVALAKSLLGRDEGQKGLLPDDSFLKDRTKEIYAVIGNGVPAKIEKAAYSISKENLSRLQTM